MFYKPHFRRLRDSQYFIRKQIDISLKEVPVGDDLKKILGQFDTYYEVWTNSFSDKYYDMTTMVRLGTIIEICLRDYFQEKMGFQNRKELKSHFPTDGNYFQQLMPWDNSGALYYYKHDLSFDLAKIPELAIVQEAMLLRHLYAHNSGIVDRQFIETYEKLTGHNIVTFDSNIANYENEDFYWFDPLMNLYRYIEGSERFFNAFPE